MQTVSHSRSIRSGFTIIELLVAVAMLLVMASLVFVAGSRAMAGAKEQRNLSQLRNLGGVVMAYAAEYGHFPPGWDPNYTSSGRGPTKMQWQTARDRYPDILNAFMESSQPTDFFLSPSADSKLPEDLSWQPINYIGHPGLIWHKGDRKALSGVGTPPFMPGVVKRPSEVFLFTDGVSKKEGDPSNNCQTSVRHWAQNGSVTKDDLRRGNQPLDLKPQSVGGNDFNGIDFRNRGKAHTLFCDGSVRAMTPKDWKVRNVALGF